jgi:hypothetical protein
MEDAASVKLGSSYSMRSGFLLVIFPILVLRCDLIQFLSAWLAVVPTILRCIMIDTCRAMIMTSSAQFDMTVVMLCARKQVLLRVMYAFFYLLLKDMLNLHQMSCNTTKFGRFQFSRCLHTPFCVSCAVTPFHDSKV